MTGRSRNRVASYWSSCRRVRLATKRSIVQLARPNSRNSLLAGGSTARRYAYSASRCAPRTSLGVPVAPDGALAQQPVRRQPGAGEHDRRPPRVPCQDHGGGEAADHLDHAVGDEVHGDGERRSRHPEIEVARHGEVVRERRILEVPHARRAHAGLGEAVVQPSRRAVAQVRAERLVNGAEHLEQHEYRPGKSQGPGERVPVLNRGDEHTHRDRERRRQGASKNEDQPPRGGKPRGRLRQNGKELPFLALGQSCDHAQILPQNWPPLAEPLPPATLRSGRGAAGRNASCRTERTSPARERRHSPTTRESTSGSPTTRALIRI